MCSMSMVMDQFNPYVPQPREWQPPVIPVVQPQPTQWTLEQMRELLESFRAAVRAAEAFDRLTGQPDCVDPEKAALEERVTELEERLEKLEAS